MQRYLTAFVPFVPVLKRTGPVARRTAMYIPFSFLFYLLSIYLGMGLLGQLDISLIIAIAYLVPRLWDALGQLGHAAFCFSLPKHRDTREGAISMFTVGYRRTRAHRKVRGSGG